MHNYLIRENFLEMALPIEALDKEELSRSRLETLSIIQELIINKKF